MGALTFFRIKSQFTDPDDIIVDRQSPQLHYSPVKVSGKRIADFYVKRLERSRPPWLKYFGKSIDLDGVPLKTASLAAVLLIKQDGVFYAVVFGYGASLLAEGVTEDRFGLRATLNAVEPSQLRSVDHKRLEATSRHTREQLSRAGGLDQFGLDINRDLLRAVTGAPTDTNYGSRLSGADHLTVVGDIPLASLGDKLKTFNDLAAQTAYRNTFPWVDNIEDIRDQPLKEALDKQLAEKLVSGTDKIWLAPPEIIEWDKTLGFRYRNTKKSAVYPDLSLSDYFNESGGAADLDDGRRLIRDRIYHIRAEDDAGQHSWSVLKCLVGEVEFKKERYVLNEGTWYRIESDYLAKLEDYIKNIPVTRIDLPEYDHATDDDEAAYNLRAWKRDKSHLAHLDENFIHYPRRGKVEVCDLYTKDRIFVHVKRLNGSSTLSHLFNQGSVSAELLRDEPDFRKQFLQKIPAFQWGNAEDPINPNDFEVCYAIVQRPNKPLDLPFFSKVSLRTVTQHIKQLGFHLSLVGIPSK